MGCYVIRSIYSAFDLPKASCMHLLQHLQLCQMPQELVVKCQERDAYPCFLQSVLPGGCTAVRARGVLLR